MSSVWSVKPETRPADLRWQDAEGQTRPFTLHLKKRLTVGEKRKLQTAGWQGVAAPGGAGGAVPEIRVDWQAISFARALAYIAEWTMRDDAGATLPITLDVLESFDEELFDLIDNAITAHVEAMEAEKNARGGASAPPQTSA